MDDDMHGEGEFRWKTGEIYRGGFKRDRRSGRGTLVLNGGEIIEGEWNDDKLIS